MLHSFKKTVAKTTAPVRGVNPGGEFLDYKNRLATIKKNLQYIDCRMEESMKYWNIRIIEQRKLSERFSSGYPISGDVTDKVTRDFEKGSTAVYDYFLRSDSEDESYTNMHTQVKAYIKAISDVEKQYPDLMYATSEAERYQAKVDSLDRRGKTNDLKRTRNLQKMDHEKLKLAAKVKTVVSAQKEVYAQAPTIYKAALCSYWSSQEHHTQVMQESMAKTTDFAKNAEEELAMLDISQMLMTEPEEGSDLTGNDSSVHSEINSTEAPARRGRAFGKVPSAMPQSPSVNGRTEDDIDSDGKTEEHEETREPIAV